jgi:hypothetical protein
MSVFGTSPTSQDALLMSAFDPKRRHVFLPPPFSGHRNLR